MHAILDEKVSVGAGAIIEGAKDALCVAGQGVKIMPGTHVASGTHLEPPKGSDSGA